jgi:hypothetical protein
MSDTHQHPNLPELGDAALAGLVCSDDAGTQAVWPLRVTTTGESINVITPLSRAVLFLLLLLLSLAVRSASCSQ